MNKQEFCNALSTAFGGLHVEYNDLCNFSVWTEKEPKWRFVLHYDYITKVESRKNSDNDTERLSKLPHGYYSLCIDPTLLLDGSMGDDVKINPISN